MITEKNLLGSPWEKTPLKKSKYGKEVIQATSDLVDLEQVIKGADEVGRKNRRDYLE